MTPFPVVRFESDPRNICESVSDPLNMDTFCRKVKQLQIRFHNINLGLCRIGIFGYLVSGRIVGILKTGYSFYFSSKCFLCFISYVLPIQYKKVSRHFMLKHAAILFY